MGDPGIIGSKYRALAGRLDEATLRLWAAVEGRTLGRGGGSTVEGHRDLTDDDLCRLGGARVGEFSLGIGRLPSGGCRQAGSRQRRRAEKAYGQGCDAPAGSRRACRADGARGSEVAAAPGV